VLFLVSSVWAITLQDAVAKVFAIYLSESFRYVKSHRQNGSSGVSVGELIGWVTPSLAAGPFTVLFRRRRWAEYRRLSREPLQEVAGNS